MKPFIFLLGVAVGLSSLLLGSPRSSTPYSSGARNYRVTVGEHEPRMLRADRIERKDGCILFWRQDRIDTIFCGEGVASITVTEIYE